MQKKLIVPLVCLAAFTVCKGREEPPPAPVATETHATATRPPAPTLQPIAALPAGAPIPANGIALWLAADDAKAAADGKLSSWTSSAVPGGTATADKTERQPSVVANALNGHAVVRFDGDQNILKTSVDISPAGMPEATIFAVFSSKTDQKSPFRKLYGDDNGGYDRAAGLDDRGGDKNYTVFTGKGDEGYFALKANETYVTADQFTKSDFSGWVNGKSTLQKVAAEWGDALPNLYLGGTGTVYHEPWQGDLAEIIVYARLLTDQERMQVEDYLGKKYGVAMAR